MMNIKAKRDIAHKTKILNHARESKNIAKTCRHFGISRETFYTWKRAYERDGEKGLINNKPCPENPTRRVAKHIEELVIYLRTTYHFGPQRIAWYLLRFHNIKISRSGCYYVLLRNKLNQLPQNQRSRSKPLFKCYQKQVPGHHVQVDVKFLFLIRQMVNELNVFNIRRLMMRHGSEHLKFMKSTIRLMPLILLITL